MTLRAFDRIEAEQLRRMKTCFHDDSPTQGEVVRSMRRWEFSRIRHTPLVPVRVAWVFASVTLLTGATLAATGALKLPAWATFHPQVAVVPPVAKPPARGASIVVQRGGHRFEYNQPINLSLLPGEHAVLEVDGNRTELVGPGVAQVRQSAKNPAWVASFEAREWAPELAAQVPLPVAMAVPLAPSSTAARPTANSAPERALAPKPPNAANIGGVDSSSVVPRNAILAERPQAPSVSSNAAPVPASEPSGAWTRAASALRVGDQARAMEALTELSYSNDASTRDAALLSRAQLDLAAGRRANAIPALQSLASTGATPFVRRRASDILASDKK